MDQAARKAFINLRLEITQDLIPKYILNYLLSKQIILQTEYEDIRNERNEVRSAEKLLDVLPTRGPLAFDEFVTSLRKDDSYPWLADALTQEYESLKNNQNININGQNMDPSIENLLLRGGVPRHRMYYVNRSDEISKVKDALISEYKNRGWVVLNGMTGCGKSTLASATFWDEVDLVRQYYNNGVFWISCGELEDSTLLIKMQSLCEKLDKTFRVHASNNIEMATDRLRVLFTEPEYENSLVVLDDVWSDSVIKAFNFGCRVLVTTSDSGIMTNASSNISYVNVSTCFTKDQSLELLAKCGSRRVTELPECAGKIHDTCKGVPIIMSTVGGYLSDYTDNNAMWDDCYYAMNRRRRSSGGNSDKTKWIEDIDAAISHSVTNLSQDLKNRYNTFAVFLDDVCVPTDTLATFWNCSTTEVTYTMTQLVKKSLVNRQLSDKQGTYEYSIHDLHLHYLKKTNADQLKQFHIELIKQYEKKCGGRWENLLDDDYIFLHIGYHLHSAGMTELMSKLFLDLKFVLAKLRVSGTADVLHDYRRYKKEIQSNIGTALNDFTSFVSTNASLLSNDKLDHLQIALKQPHSSQVYNQAKEIIKSTSEQQSFYLDWCKRDVVPKPCISSSKNHNEPIYCATFTRNVNNFVSCGRDGKIRIWDCGSGKEIYRINAHDDAITCCSISEESKALVTCSLDNTIKVWNLELKEHKEPYNNISDTESINESPPTPTSLKSLVNSQWSFQPPDDAINQSHIRIFSENQHIPRCCAISATGEIVVSGGDDGNIKVWSVTKEKLVKTLQGHTGAAICCQFSRDNAMLATGSEDGTLKLWDRKWRLLKTFTGPNNPVVSCDFLCDGSKVIGAIYDSVWTWDIVSGQLGKIYTDCSQSAITSISVSEKQLAIGTAGCSIMVMSLDGKEKNFHTGHKGWIHCVSFSENGERLLSASEDGIVMVWDTLDKPQSGIKYRKYADARFSNNNFTLALVNRDNSIEISDENTKSHVIDMKHISNSISCCVLNHRGDSMAVCYDNGTLRVFHIKCDNPDDTCGTTSLHDKRISCCAFSYDDSIITTGSDDYSVGLMFSKNQRYTCRRVLCHTEKVVDVKFFNDNEKLLSCSYDKTLVVLEILSGNVLTTFCGHTESVLACDISLDNQLIASASADNTAKLWNANDGLVIATYNYDNCVRSCVISPNCSLLITGDDKGEIKIWDIAQTNSTIPILEIQSWISEQTWVRGLFVSSDDKLLLSASDNLRWWEIKSGQCLQTFPIQGNALLRVCASPRFDKFVAVDDANIFYHLTAIK